VPPVFLSVSETENTQITKLDHPGEKITRGFVHRVAGLMIIGMHGGHVVNVGFFDRSKRRMVRSTTACPQFRFVNEQIQPDIFIHFLLKLIKT